MREDYIVEFLDLDLTLKSNENGKVVYDFTFDHNGNPKWGILYLELDKMEIKIREFPEKAKMGDMVGNLPDAELDYLFFGGKLKGIYIDAEEY